MDSMNTATRNIEWKIHNFTKELAVEGKEVSTSNFEILIDNKSTKWYLRAVIRESNLAVFLRMRQSNANDFTVICGISIRTINDEMKSRHRFVKTLDDYKICKGYGWPTLISIDDIFKDSSKVLQNGSIKLGFKIRLTKNTIMKEGNKELTTDSKYVAAFKDYFDTKNFYDLTFVCSDKTEIPAHRFVLAAFSPFMKNVLQVGSAYIIRENDIDGKTMTEILRYIYTEKVNNIENYAPKLLFGAEKYELNGLKNLCAASMIKNLTVGNAMDYYYLAGRYGLKDLLEHCAKFIKENHQVLDSNEQNWEKLDKKEVISLLGYYQQSPVCSLLFESSF